MEEKKSVEENPKADDLVAFPPPPGFKELKPAKGQRKDPPKIKWGKDFKSWKQERKIMWLQELASSMNHAADMMQRERDALQVVLFKKENLIIEKQKQLDETSKMLNEAYGEFNKEKQILLERIQEHEQMIADLRRKIKDGDNN